MAIAGEAAWELAVGSAGRASTGVPAIAIATYRPGWSGDRIVLVRPDGQAIPVTDGQLAG